MGSRRADHALLLRSGRGNTGGAGLGRARGGLVVAQVALVAVLLVAAGLLGRSLWKLQRVELGFDLDGVLAITVARAKQMSPGTDEARRLFLDELVAEAQTVAGVTAAGMVQHLPLTGERSTTGYAVEGTEITGGMDLRVAGGDFFAASGTAVVAGRSFTPADNAAAPNVYIVNRALAKNLGGDVIGRRLAFEWGGVVDGRIVPVKITGDVVGVVEDVRESGPASPAAPALYRPFAQHPRPTMTLVLRTRRDAADLARAVIARIHALHPEHSL
ncbi:MAG: ABC transporter permease [Vicinamibacteraceae bacterium]